MTARWDEGVPHDPRSIALYKAIAKIDFEECGDFFGFKSGGDGDSGEALMYLLDVFFERGGSIDPPSPPRARRTPRSKKGS